MNLLLRYLLVLVFALFVSRAFFLTVIMRGYYSNLASGNRIKVLDLPAARGVILDRTGKMIASNIQVGEEVVRHYPDGEVVASIVGYISDRKGVAGLEKQYEESLRGKPGERVIEETAVGKEVKEVKMTEPTPGRELTLSLDLPLQKAAYWSLKDGLSKNGKSGSVVISKTTGEVLALVSLPSFDPNLFIASGKRGAEGGMYADAKAVVNDAQKQPLFNRAISGSFAPGSVFKLLTAFAGLQEGVIDENDLISDSGEIVIGNYRYGNWYFDKYGKTEGQINVTRALARSNDIFFYKLGEKIGVDSLVDWSTKLGMGQKTGIDLSAEASGLMPSPLWMEKEKGNRWFLGNTYHLSIGQGDLLATPLQINRLTATIATGKKCRPTLLKLEKVECEDLGLSDEARKVVLTGMKQACSPGGTAFQFFDLKGKILCKTGTAQHGGEKDKPHAWFTSIVPGDIVVTVMVESGGEGSEVAAPIARKLVDYLLLAKY